MSWWLYVLVSAGGDRTYVGVSTDAERRLSQHNGEIRGGAKATRAGRPWRLTAVSGPFAGRGEAQSAEHELRRRRSSRRSVAGVCRAGRYRELP